MTKAAVNRGAYRTHTDFIQSNNSPRLRGEEKGLLFFAMMPLLLLPLSLLLALTFSELSLPLLKLFRLGERKGLLGLCARGL